MRRHGMVDFNKTGGLTLWSSAALADYIAAVSKSAQADVGATRLFPANSNSRGTCDMSTKDNGAATTGAACDLWPMMRLYGVAIPALSGLTGPCIRVSRR